MKEEKVCKKQCKDCKKTLSLTRFWKDNRGYYYFVCIECGRKRKVENYWKNREEILLKVKEYYGKNREKRLEYARKRNKREHVMERHRKEMLESYRKDPTKFRARSKVYWAIAGGRLERKPCEVCGSPKSEGHHPDYSKPLQVIWLCVDHHREIHSKSYLNE